MSAAASITPVGDWFDRKHGGRISTHALGSEDSPGGCAAWHPACAYLAGRGEALRQLAADLEADALALDTLGDLGEIPWAAMLGARIDSAATAAAILRRDAQLARDRAESPPAPPNVLAAADASRAPQPPGSSEDGTA